MAFLVWLSNSKENAKLGGYFFLPGGRLFDRKEIFGLKDNPLQIMLALTVSIDDRKVQSL